MICDSQFVIYGSRFAICCYDLRVYVPLVIICDSRFTVYNLRLPTCGLRLTIFFYDLQFTITNLRFAVRDLPFKIHFLRFTIWLSRGPLYSIPYERSAIYDLRLAIDCLQLTIQDLLFR